MTDENKTMGSGSSFTGMSSYPLSDSGSNGSSSGSNANGTGSDSNKSKSNDTPKRLKRKSAELASKKTHLIYNHNHNNEDYGMLEDATHNTIKTNKTFVFKLEEPGLQNSPIINSDSSKLSSPFHDKDITSMLNVDLRKVKMVNLKKGDFVEPPLAPPKPSYSGVPLESFPPTKVRKDSLWPRSKKSKTNDKDPMIIEFPVDNNEKEYKMNLTTKESYKLTQDSKIRTNVKPSINPKSKAPTPSSNKSVGTPKVKVEKLSDSPLRSSKRIKVISPKKSITSSNLAPSLNKNDGEVSQLDDASNDDFCSACGGSGVFICCETCPKSFHFICCDPPLDDLPEENWSCRECLARQNPEITKKWNSIGLFGQLLNQTESMNPFEFQLPKKLRDNTFLKVSTDAHGQYDDGTLKPELSYSKLNGSQIPGFNYNHSLEVDSLYDKSGKPYLCHNCGLSGLENRFIVHCDYCPLVWHMDCLTEPCYKSKTIGSKWRCPNHIENLIPINIFGKRNLKDSPILDVSLHNNFLKILHNSNFLIKYRDQPFFKTDSDKFPTLQEYLQYEMEDFKRFNPNYSKSIFDPEGVNTLDNNDDIHESFKVPDFFNNNYSIPNSMVGKPNSKLKKIITMTDEDDPFNVNDNENFKNNKVNSFIYRVPEELILLDFITKVKKPSKPNRRMQQKFSKEAKEDILKTIEYYENEKDKEIEIESEFIENSEYFKDNDIIKNGQDHSKLENLVKVALKEEDKEEDSTNEDLTNEEILSIKKLMKIKGRNALIEFLTS